MSGDTYLVKTHASDEFRHERPDWRHLVRQQLHHRMARAGQRIEAIVARREHTGLTFSAFSGDRAVEYAANLRRTRKVAT